MKEFVAAQPIFAVYNLVDLVDDPLEVRPPDLAVSAKTGYILDRLTAAVYEFFAQQYSDSEYFFPFSELRQSSILSAHATNFCEEITDQGVAIKAYVDARLESLLQPFQM